MKYFILLYFIYYYIFFLLGCGTTEVARPHLHNFPYLGECPSLEERSIENEDFLKAQAKALNIRYVDYLHYLTNRARKEDEILGVNN
jgi:hypothetical protein